MPLCVHVLPPGTQIGTRVDGVTISSVALVAPDPSCTGDYRIYTSQEISALGAGSNVPDAQLMRESFFMSFGLVLGCYLLGKCVGAVLRLIKGEEGEFR